ncbi:MAG: cobyric acid synthase [Acidimicrobiia bacterium]
MTGAAAMVVGCTSDAGKSFLVAGLCRWFSNQGVRVAPFKAQNMSNNAAVCADGSEIGRAQHLQATAARVEPSARNNPVLLKPVALTASKVIVNGVPAPHIERQPWTERFAALWPVVCDALDDLRAAYDLVLIEGAGSPAEINLKDGDIVNMRVARRENAATYLVSDIDRGGSFAHLLGTWQCLDAEERALLTGFVLNRFRGDPTLLGDGPEWLRRRTGVPIAAVVPWIEHSLPEEDRLVVRAAAGNRAAAGKRAAAGNRAAGPCIAVVGYPFASNTDEFDPLSRWTDVTVELLSGVAALDRFDLVVLPGSRNVAASMDWLRASGFNRELVRYARAGGTILGICGGLQLLGRAVFDDAGVEFGDARMSIDGLGLLDIETRLDPVKTTRVTTTTLLPAGAACSGYEIHHGRTTAIDDVDALLADGLGFRRGNVLGVYLHGLLGDPVFARYLRASIGLDHLEALADPWDLVVDRELDRLAGCLEDCGLAAHVASGVGFR